MANQFLRPNIDIQSWNSEIPNQWSKIDEVVADDADYSYTSPQIGGDFPDATMVVGTTNPSTPASGTCTCRYRAKCSIGGLANTNITTTVRENGVDKVSDVIRTLTTSYQTFSFTFSTSLISNWNNVEIKFYGYTERGAQDENVYVSWAEIEIPGGLIIQAVAGTLTFLGGIIRKNNKGLSAILTFSGGLIKKISKNVSGLLNFVGTAIRKINKNINGGLNFIGVIVKGIKKNIEGISSFIGGIVKKANRSINGGLSFIGGLIKNVGKSMDSVLSFIGGLALTKAFIKTINGVLDFTGQISKKVNKEINGSLSFFNTITKDIKININGGLDFIGNLNINKIILQILSGGLSFIGNTNKVISSQLIGNLSFLGGLIKKINKSIDSTLSFIGELALIKIFIKVINGVLDFTGQISKKVNKEINGSLSFISGINRIIYKNINGVLDFIGMCITGIIKIIEILGTLAFSGNIIKNTKRDINGIISFIGNINKNINKIINGSLTFIGGINKFINKSIFGSIFFNGYTIVETIAEILAKVKRFVYVKFRVIEKIKKRNKNYIIQARKKDYEI